KRISRLFLTGAPDASSVRSMTPISATDAASGDWPMIEAQLPPRFREMAEEHKVIRKTPPQLRAKITDAAVVLRLILHHVAAGVSLKVTCATAAAVNLVNISSVALHLRMRTSGSWLAALVTEMIAMPRAFEAARWAGYEIMVVDATALTRPGAKGTTARIHYVLRLTDLDLAQHRVTDEHVGETFRWFSVEKDQLWMGDRAYANPPAIAFVKAGGGDVLVRYNFGSLPLYDARRRRLDVRGMVAKLGSPGRVQEWPVSVLPESGEVIRGRLCAVRLPPKKAQEARARLRREQGASLTQESIATAEFVVVFTTVPKKRLSAVRVMELYSLRWQVELHIKRDKSIRAVDELQNVRPDTIHSWICAKLLAQQIAQRIATPAVAFPPSAVGQAALAG
ncbi:MAG: transposase, partial [Deltaproteobacteria bacterium]